MSSSLIRQDLVPVISGYVLLMGALALGLWLSRRPRRPARDRLGRRLPDWFRHGWPRLLRHLAGTALGGYVLLMAVVVGYYYGVARVSGSFLDSAITGCLLLIGLSLPLFAGASWLTEWRLRRARGRGHRDQRAPADRAR
jgi:Family of unknown function (DUF6256)